MRTSGSDVEMLEDHGDPKDCDLNKENLWSPSVNTSSGMAFGASGDV
jgi:hypothetical protein